MGGGEESGSKEDCAWCCARVLSLRNFQNCALSFLLSVLVRFPAHSAHRRAAVMSSSQLQASWAPPVR